MTGRDPILNRRIASIFVNEFENFITLLKNLPSEPNAENIRFSLHKLRPSLVIFEMDKIIKHFESLSNRKENSDPISENDTELIEVVQESEHQLAGVRLFLDQL